MPPSLRCTLKDVKAAVRRERFDCLWLRWAIPLAATSHRPMAKELTYTFAHFELLPERRALNAGGGAVKLGARAFDVLVALVERHDRVVGKHELMELAWPRLVVEDNNLNVQIVMLRKLLGHPAIATVPGRGYRFALPVSRTGGTASAVDGPAATAPPGAGLHRADAPERRSNLPANLPVLYGRDDDVAAVLALLDANALVTISGAGGIGKTRLAQHVGLGAESRFAGGVWWVELASLSQGALIAATVAKVLGLDVGERDPLRAVLAHLRSRRLLLVLDNGEHVLDALASFAEAIGGAAPDMCVLVTSQEILRSVGERVYRLDTLGVPPVGTSTSPAAAIASGAGALFAARASAVEPRFQVTSANVDSVLDICRRLDGIPLAIELAAARLPLLGVEGLRAKLNQRFNVLTGGARAVLRRHQTLRAALDWSHGLLSGAEQAVFRRIGVFAGGFTLEAAQHVAADDDGIDSWDVLEHLGALIDKSLILAEGDPLPRYRLLETTRMFALERLGEANETESTLGRHVEAITHVLDAIDRNAWYGDLPSAQRATIALEVDNVRAGLAWLESTRDDRADLDDLAIEFGSVAGEVLAQASGATEAFAHTLALRSRITSSTPDAIAAQFWYSLTRLGVIASNADSYDAALRGAELYGRLGHDLRRFVCLSSQIGIGARRGLGASLGPVVAAAQRLYSPQWPASIRLMFCWACYRWRQSQGLLEESLAGALDAAGIAREAGDLQYEQVILGDSVADSELALGRLDAAEAHARGALDAIGTDPGADRFRAHVLDVLAQVLAVQGKHDEAIATAKRALRMSKFEGFHFRLLEPIALSAAGQGRARDAAWVTGYVDALYQQLGEVRWPAVVARRDRLDALLAEALDREAIATLRAAGERGDEALAFAKVFGDSDASARAPGEL